MQNDIKNNRNSFYHCIFNSNRKYQLTLKKLYSSIHHNCKDNYYDANSTNYLFFVFLFPFFFFLTTTVTDNLKICILIQNKV